MATGDRLPPQDAQAEEAVIGSILIDPMAIAKIGAVLKPEYFASERTKACYEAALDLFRRAPVAPKEGDGQPHGAPINQVTLAFELKARGVLNAMGGPEYLTNLIQATPTSVAVEHYAAIIRRTWMLRQIIEAGESIAELGHSQPDPDAALRDAEDLLYRIRAPGSNRGLMPVKDILDQYLLERKSRKDGLGYFIPTGFVDLDRLLGGLQRSDLVILAARPGMGKSALALNIVQHAAKQGGKVALFSLEMGREQLTDRLLSGISGVDTFGVRLFRMEAGMATHEEALMAALGDLSELPIWIDDSGVVTVEDLRGRARRHAIEQGVDLLVVDYLQLMRAEGKHGIGDRVQEVSEISRSLKWLAKDLDVPVIALSQLNRAVELRPDHRPKLADLRESGSLEQDADVVLMLYRDELYYKPEEWERLFPDKPYPKGVTELSVAKHRHGGVGTVQLFFQEKTTSFKNYYAGQVAYTAQEARE